MAVQGGAGPLVALRGVGDRAVQDGADLGGAPVGPRARVGGRQGGAGQLVEPTVPVVLLSGEVPEVLTDASVTELLDPPAAILDAGELALFEECPHALRRNGMRTGRRVEVDGAVLTVREG
ncbi:hypothetical protein ABZ357_40810 [Streptomyces sp. NPDC005917]|uniref:hypothetical protein n=1 Tax=unclassified Streptomyces TaxID=2593676 RepID=UPI0033C5F680